MVAVPVTLGYRIDYSSRRDNSGELYTPRRDYTTNPKNFRQT